MARLEPTFVDVKHGGIGRPLAAHENEVADKPGQGHGRRSIR